jgi:hypothetical protein
MAQGRGIQNVGGHFAEAFAPDFRREEKKAGRGRSFTSDAKTMTIELRELKEGLLDYVHFLKLSNKERIEVVRKGEPLAQFNLAAGVERGARIISVGRFRETGLDALQNLFADHAQVVLHHKDKVLGIFSSKTLLPGKTLG